jgi:Ca2+-binding EF-hand superfamily protein
VSDEMLDRLRFFAGRHELVRLFSQAVAFSVGRDEVRDLMKLFVKLDRDGDGTINAADVEVGLLGAPPEEVDEEHQQQISRGSLTIMASPRNKINGSKFPGFHTVDEATRHRRKRRREANYLFAAMDVQKKGKVSLNEFLAATLPQAYYKDEKLLGEAFARICGANAGSDIQQVVLNVRVLEGMLGSRFSDRRARRLMGEFVALAKFGGKEVSNPPPEPSPTGAPTSPIPMLTATASGRLRKFGSMGAVAKNANDEEGDGHGVSPRRVDVEVLKFDDFCKGMMHAIA